MSNHIEPPGEAISDFLKNWCRYSSIYIMNICKLFLVNYGNFLK